MTTTAHQATDPAGHGAESGAGAGRFGTGPAVLDAVVAAARGEQRCAAEKLAAALAWAHAHPGTDGDCASWDPQFRIAF